MDKVIYDPILGELRQSDGGGSGGGGGGDCTGIQPMVCRVFADDHYGMAAHLDAENGMEFAGYCAERIGKLELYLVSADPNHTGDIVLMVGGEPFTVPVTASVSKATIVPGAPLTGRIAIVRDVGDSADTLAIGGVPVTAKVVDWRCF